MVEGSAGARRPSLWSMPLLRSCADAGIHVETGRFGAMMSVELVNDGPYTLVIEV